MTGRSTTVSISFGMALVAGKKRVPSPATGNTALRMRFWEAGMGKLQTGGAATGADLEWNSGESRTAGVGGRSIQCIVKALRW